MDNLNNILEKFDSLRTVMISKNEWNENAVAKCFEPCAKEILLNGYFLVKNKYAIELGSIELYYHEENGPIKDYIMYHREGRVNSRIKEYNRGLLPYFDFGTLNLHQSGVDITFEDNRHPENPEYRASVLIRAFRVEEVKTIPGLLFTQTVDERSTYFYNALFMGVNVIAGGMRVYWHDNDVKECEVPLSKPRLNVGEFVKKTRKKGYIYYEKKKEFKQDERAWAFYR